MPCKATKTEPLKKGHDFTCYLIEFYPSKTTRLDIEWIKFNKIAEAFFFLQKAVSEWHSFFYYLYFFHSDFTF